MHPSTWLLSDADFAACFSFTSSATAAATATACRASALICQLAWLQRAQPSPQRQLSSDLHVCTQLQCFGWHPSFLTNTVHPSPCGLQYPCVVVLLSVASIPAKSRLEPDAPSLGWHAITNIILAMPGCGVLERADLHGTSLGLVLMTMHAVELLALQS